MGVRAQLAKVSNSRRKLRYVMYFFADIWFVFYYTMFFSMFRIASIGSSTV